MDNESILLRIEALDLERKEADKKLTDKLDELRMLLNPEAKPKTLTKPIPVIIVNKEPIPTTESKI